MFTKYLVPAVAVLGLASAASTTNPCSLATATTINSNADATALASQCTAVTGTISIGPSATGAIDLGSINTIQGDLVCLNATKLTGLTASYLTTITGAMNLQKLTILSTLSFPVLSAVGSLNWITLNALQFLGFTNNLKTATTIYISDTQLNNLDGIDVSTVANLDINNNLYLEMWQTSIGNVTSAFSMAANGGSLSLTFPNLIWAANMSLRDVANVSMPSLTTVNGSLGFYEGTMQTIMLPNLTTVGGSFGSTPGGDLSIVADSKLTNFSAPLLKTVNGGLLIANNSQLLNINGLNALASTKSISMSGNFSEATLPSLKTDSGALYAVSSGNFSCTQFNGYSAKGGSGVVQGTVTCSSGSSDVQSGGVSGTSAPGSASSSTSKAAASGLTVDMSTAFGSVMFVSLFTVIGGLAGFAQLVL